MTVYFVDSYHGQNSYDGLAPSTAKRTFSSIGSLLPGDLVCFCRGREFKETITIGDSGNSQQSILFKDYGNKDSDAPIIQGADHVHGWIKKGTEQLLNPRLETWASPTNLSSWTEVVVSSTINEESSEVYIGTRSCRFDMISPTTAGLYQHSVMLQDNTNYRLCIYHKSDEGTAGFKFSLARGDADLVIDEYLQYDGTWAAATKAFGIRNGRFVPSDYTGAEYMDAKGNEWGCFVFDFNTGANAGNHDYYRIYIEPFILVNGKSLYLGSVSIGEIGVTSSNLFENGNFEEWDSDSAPTDWTPINEGDTYLVQSENERYGTYGVRMDGGTLSSYDVGVSQTVYIGSPDTYRFGIHHHKNAAQVDGSGKIAVQIIRSSDGYYYDGAGSWQAAEVDAKEYEEYEYSFESFTFDVDTADIGNYTFIIHRSINDPLEPHEQYYFDHATLQVSEDNDNIYQTYWGGLSADPNYLFITGTLNGESVDHLQLFHDEDAPSDAFPVINGYAFGTTVGTLYINAGEDLADCDVQAPVRTNNLDMAGNSYLTFRNMTFTKSLEDGVLLGYDTSTPPDTLKMYNCTVEYSEDGGIIGGYRVGDPEISDTDSPELGDYIPPANITIEECVVKYWNRSRKAKIYYSGASTSAWADQWSSPQWGIGVFPGSLPYYSGSDHGTITIRQNQVINDYPIINYSTERNGIEICVGQTVIVEDNYVTGTDHAMFFIGRLSALDKWYGDVLDLFVRRNFTYKTGDDSCVLLGCGTAPSHVCYNLFVHSGDNICDANNSGNVHFYNNFCDGTYCENGLYALWGGKTTIQVFCYNNIFFRWGTVLRTDKPGAIKGCAIEIWTAVAGGSIDFSLFDNNIYYEDRDTDTADYPIVYATGAAGNPTYTQLTLSQWQSTYGFDLNSLDSDPQVSDIDNDEYYLLRSSPAFGAGIDLSELDASVSVYGFDVPWDKDEVQEMLLATTSSWPSEVSYTEQPSDWNIGPWQKDITTLTKGSGEDDFPTDRSLIGVPVFLVDATNKRIWKGIIISNTASVLTVDAWEPLFNASGYEPSGSLAYYIGYIYLYDQTPGYAFLSNERNKTLTGYELFTNRVDEDQSVFARLSVNQGARYNVSSATLSGDRLHFPDFGAAHKVIQLEHGMVTDQKIQIKMSTFYVESTEGQYE